MTQKIPLRSLLAPSARHQVTQQFATAGVVVLLVYVDQQFDGFVADRLFQGIRDENSLEGLQKRPVDVVSPEGVQVGELRELNVTNDGAQVSGLQDGVGLVEALKLALYRLLLVGEHVTLQSRLVLAVLCADPKTNVCKRQGRGGRQYQGIGQAWSNYGRGAIRGQLNSNPAGTLKSRIQNLKN